MYQAIESPSAKRHQVSTTRKRILRIAVDEDGPISQSIMHQEQKGAHEAVHVPDHDISAIKDVLNRPKHLLGQWMATAVCGNDVLSSCTYSSGVVAMKAGVLSPVAFLLVSFFLYMYRFVYEEVVTAIPLNGGSYNILLNTTTKRFAAVAACLSILCYTATAVVSATTAVSYLQLVIPSLPTLGTIIALLGAFAILMIIGIKESAIVASAIFFFHVMTLSILTVVTLVYTIRHPETFKENYSHLSFPTVDFMGSMISGDFGTAIFFGFGAAVLGVTGFETSSNFIEEQKPGVFRNTMRNMWSISSFFNIVLSIVCFGVLKMDGDDGIERNKYYVLAQMGLIASGKWAQWLVCFDAFIVLSGAVLTSYVGINGLVRRLASDRVMPAFLAQKNQVRGTCHWIVISFFAIASSLVLALNADQIAISGVYTFSFLSLMFLFSCGCIMLKLKRQDIPRDIQTPWWCCILGMTLVAWGILANLLGDPKALMYFITYFIIVFILVFSMLERVFIMRVLIVITNIFFKDEYHRTPAIEVFNDNEIEPAVELNEQVDKDTYAPTYEQETVKVSALVRSIRAVRNAPVVFYIKKADLTTINKAILYVRANEITKNLRFIHIYSETDIDTLEIVDQLKEMIAMFDCVYPKLQLDFYSVVGNFEPTTIEWISQKYEIPTNMMFLKQPTNISVKAVSAYGVRVITG